MNRLIDHGISRQLAGIIIETINNFTKNKSQKFATKSDITVLRHEIEKLEMRMIIKLGTMMAFWASVLASLIKLT
jgi:hypothetical protein